MWPEDECDGVSVWPGMSTGQGDIGTFIEAFRTAGFDLCDETDIDEGYEKVALYCDPNSEECTHAARQLENGLWSSKLGSSNDIQHSTPYSIQGRLYGNVACVLRRCTVRGDEDSNDW